MALGERSGEGAIGVELIFGVLFGLIAIVVVSIAAVVLVVWTLVRRVRRSRALHLAVLRNRARFSSGPRRRVFALRLRLRELLDSGRAAIDLVVRNDGRHGDLPRIFRRIADAGTVLDAQLSLMESETDRATLAEQTRAADIRVEQIADMVHRLRKSVALGLGDPDDGSLAVLRAELNREVDALHAGLLELRDLTAADADAGASGSTFAPSYDRLHTRGAS